MKKVLTVVALVGAMLVPVACSTQSAEAYTIPWFVCNPGTHWVNDSYTLSVYRHYGYDCYQVPVFVRG